MSLLAALAILVLPLAAGGGLLWTILVILAIVALLVFILGRGRWSRRP